MTDQFGTAKGGVFRTPPIERVVEGMRVFDVDGREIGVVEYVKFGDPEAITTQGNESENGIGFAAVPWRMNTGDTSPTNRGFGLPIVGGGEPDVEDPLRSQLLREGFVKIDGTDLFDTDRYVRADQILDVSGDSVRIALREREVPKETEL